MRSSRLPYVKTLAGFDFTFQPSVKREQIDALHELGFLERKENVVFLGPPGSGKSSIACALGHQACRLGISTRYYRVSRLLDELTLARGDGSYPKVIQPLARIWLLVLDDWGLASLSGQGRHDLLEVLDDRYARRDTLLASQIPVDHWHDIVGTPTFGDAILDRLFNNAHRITLQGRIDEKALRLDEDRLHTLDFNSTLNPHTQRPYGPPLLQGDRHRLESAIGLAESVVGIAGMGNGLEGVFVECEGAFGRVLPGRPQGRFFGGVEVGPVGRLADPGAGARRRRAWTGYYLSFSSQRGHVLRAPVNHPASSQTHPLQMKWPFTQVRAPLTAFSFPHLSQVRFDKWSWLLSCRDG